MRWLIWAMVLIGAFGIARVLFSASDDRAEWMRWAPSVDLEALAPGEQRVLGWKGNGYIVAALTPAEVKAVHDVDPRTLPFPEPLEERLLRVEINGETRYFATIAARVPIGSACHVSRRFYGWEDPCNCGVFDFAGRTFGKSSCANLPRPNFVIADRTLYLHPNQPLD